MPEISVIVPSFNEEKRIARCLDSILNQTFSDFEVICIDDHSTDNTIEIIHSYMKKDSRIKLFENPQKGVSAARNFGIEKSEGVYVGFVDSDDFIQPQMYEFLYKAITENNADISLCGYKRTESFIPQLFEYTAAECLCHQFISFTDEQFVVENDMNVSSCCNKLISKKMLSDEIRFENFSIGEDTVFCSMLWAKSHKNIYVGLPLYGYFTNSESVMHRPFSDKRFVDLITTRFVTYELLKSANKMCAEFYLQKGFYYTYFLNYFSRKSENRSLFRKESEKYVKQYIVEFLKSKNIILNNKIKFLLFYYLPISYIVCRYYFYGKEI